MMAGIKSADRWAWDKLHDGCDSLPPGYITYKKTLPQRFIFLQLKQCGMVCGNFNNGNKWFRKILKMMRLKKKMATSAKGKGGRGG